VGQLPRQLEIACIDPHQTGFVGKGSDRLQLIKFWPSCAPGKGVCGGAKICGSASLQPVACSVYVSLSAFFHIFCRHGTTLDTCLTAIFKDNDPGKPITPINATILDFNCSTGPSAKLQSNQHHRHRLPTSNFLQVGCPSCRPTNCVRSLKSVTCFTIINSTDDQRCNDNPDNQ